MNQEKKRKFNPWAIEKSFTQAIGSKPDTKRSKNDSEFVIEISNEKSSKILSTITSLCSTLFQVRVEVEIFCDKFNQNHSPIYIHDDNIPDIEDYGSEL